VSGSGLGRRRVCGALAITFGLWLAVPRSVDTQTANTVEVKAAFLYNFAKFVEWPSDATSGMPTINMGVLGSDAMGDALRAAVRDKAVGGKGFAVRKPANLDDLTGLHLLFVGDAEKHRVPDILRRLEGATVLTVSDIDRFCQLGGTIALVVENNHVRFDVRLDTAQRSRLKVSSKLLGLARTVHGANVAKQGERE
jgi:hypothetical protein